MKTLIVVPARYESSRFPGKPLIQLTGVDGKKKPLIQRSWEAAIAVKNVDVIVATDDDRIRIVAEGFGAKVVMTSQKCVNGTERCADAIANIDIKYDLIVNLQGDAPLSPAWFVQDLIDSFEDNLITDMATPVLRCDPDTILAFKDDRSVGRVGGTTAVFDHNNKALYFSKEVLPYSNKTDAPIYHHVGIYAFTNKALIRYISLERSKLEIERKLEQLRALENKMTIDVGYIDACPLSVDTESDLIAVKKLMER